MMVDMFEDHSPEVDITFTRQDLRDVVPHDNDPIVISLVTAGRKVHRVLVDQGSSTDVMFWPTFTQLELPLDQLRPYGGCLYGFVGDQVEVRGYIELRTTFTDVAGSRTEKIKYLVYRIGSFSIQHPVGKAHAQQDRCHTIDPAHEGEVVVHGGGGYHHQIRSEGSKEVL